MHDLWNPVRGLWGKGRASRLVTGCTIMSVVVVSLLTGCGEQTGNTPQAQSNPTTPVASGQLTAPSTPSTPESVTSDVARVQDAATPTQAPTSTPAPSPTPVTPEPVQLNDLAWSPDGRSLAVSSATGVYFFDAQNWGEARFLPMVGNVESMAFNYDGTQLGTAVDDGGKTHHYSLLIWNTADGSLVHALDKFGHGLQASRHSPLWAALDANGNAALWQSEDNRTTRIIPKPSQDVSGALAVSADGNLVAVSSFDGIIGIYRTDNGLQVAYIVDREEGDPITTQWGDLVFDPTGRIFAGGGWSDLIVFFNAQNGRLMRRVYGGTPGSFDRMVMALDFAPDGSVLASTHNDSFVRLWNADGSARNSWKVEGGWLRDVVFSPDGQHLAVIAGELVYIFTADGTLLTPLQPVFHPRATPAPTPTPIDLMPNVSIPSDWQNYQEIGGRFSLWHPPTWRLSMDEEYGLFFGIDGLPLMLSIHLQSVSNSFETVPIEEITSLERLTANTLANRQPAATTVTSSGQWPYLIPGSYIEVENAGTDGNYREVRVRSPLDTQNYVEAIMLGDSTAVFPETLRKDLSRVIASIELTGQPYVSPTPTATPTPKIMANPPPITPLIITVTTDPARLAANEYFTLWVELRDESGHPVTEADVIPIYFGDLVGSPLSHEGNGLYRTRTALSNADPQMVIRVKWGELILQEELFMLPF